MDIVRMFLREYLWMIVIVAVVTIVLLTVLGQVLKTANEDPAEVVKSE